MTTPILSNGTHFIFLYDSYMHAMNPDNVNNYVEGTRGKIIEILAVQINKEAQKRYTQLTGSKDQTPNINIILPAIHPDSMLLVYCESHGIKKPIDPIQCVPWVKKYL